ncbi:hypothetical protein B296_00041039 [Ensete ventricosum]|uniref:Uncharacterized protein n=1 Tax=Ensete ventricosum TaxID=4639 RepID=A0A426ZNJ5_ENSVE|nr:hypothetical protein B296_00041039 [Ensete ventricosum]
MSSRPYPCQVDRTIDGSSMPVSGQLRCDGSTMMERGIKRRLSSMHSSKELRIPSMAGLYDKAATPPWIAPQLPIPTSVSYDVVDL